MQCCFFFFLCLSDAGSIDNKCPDVELKIVKDDNCLGERESIINSSKKGQIYQGTVSKNLTASPSLAERDSGCYVGPTDFDSQSCLTSHDALNEEGLWTLPCRDTNVRYSWPIQTIHEDIIDKSLEEDVAAEHVQSTSDLSSKV